MTEALFWDERAKKEYTYKGERFYTVTAIPYYYERRSIILGNIISLIHSNDVICDLGCGDGEYIRSILRKKQKCKIHGVDISKEMIGIAKKQNVSNLCTWEVSSNGISLEEKFDIIYSSALYAHISDDIMIQLLHNSYDHIKPEGNIVICEQTSPFRYSGDTYIRRSTSEYIHVLETCGFKIKNVFVIDFWFHRLVFERKIGKYFIKKCMEKYNISDKNEAMIILNRENGLYKNLSRLCVMLSHPRIFKKKNRWGYVFIVAGK